MRAIHPGPYATPLDCKNGDSKYFPKINGPYQNQMYSGGKIATI